MRANLERQGSVPGTTRGSPYEALFTAQASSIEPRYFLAIIVGAPSDPVQFRNRASVKMRLCLPLSSLPSVGGGGGLLRHWYCVFL